MGVEQEALEAVIIGGGPAGLMAADVLSAQGVAVQVFDAMPTLARKFLLAGKGGLNITHSEPLEPFLARYGEARPRLEACIRAFPPEQLRAWVHGLGVQTFVGSSGRVFPEEMKAAPLLRAWLRRLRQQGVLIHTRHRWLGWQDGALRFATPEGERLVRAKAVLLALGGGSWAKLGSDGAWVETLHGQGLAVSPLRPSNCGFEVAGWSEHFRTRCAGEPLKSIAIHWQDAQEQSHSRRGECLITEQGVEGSLIYAISRDVRQQIERQGQALLHLDLLPDYTPEKVLAEVSRPRGSRSLSSHLQSRLGLKGVRMALLRELLSQEQFQDETQLAAGIKALPLRLCRTRPLDEAISSAGGLEWSEVDEHWMLTRLPGHFCAGEMLDWEAPTGGYLLTACMASGRSAAQGLLRWLGR